MHISPQGSKAAFPKTHWKVSQTMHQELSHGTTDDPLLCTLTHCSQILLPGLSLRMKGCNAAAF